MRMHSWHLCMGASCAVRLRAVHLWSCLRPRGECTCAHRSGGAHVHTHARTHGVQCSAHGEHHSTSPQACTPMNAPDRHGHVHCSVCTFMHMQACVWVRVHVHACVYACASPHLAQDADPHGAGRVEGGHGLQEANWRQIGGKLEANRRQIHTALKVATACRRRQRVVWARWGVGGGRHTPGEGWEGGGRQATGAYMELHNQRRSTGRCRADAEGESPAQASHAAIIISGQSVSAYLPWPAGQQPGLLCAARPAAALNSKRAPIASLA